METAMDARPRLIGEAEYSEGNEESFEDRLLSGASLRRRS